MQTDLAQLRLKRARVLSALYFSLRGLSLKALLLRMRSLDAFIPQQNPKLAFVDIHHRDNQKQVEQNIGEK